MGDRVTISLSREQAKALVDSSMAGTPPFLFSKEVVEGIGIIRSALLQPEPEPADSLEADIAECEAKGYRWLISSSGGWEDQDYYGCVIPPNAEENGNFPAWADTPLAAIRAAMAKAEETKADGHEHRP